MKVFCAVVAVLALVGCSAESAPTPVSPAVAAPPPPPAPPAPTTAWLIGVVVHETGACIAGGNVEVLSGQRVGERFEQGPHCDAWNADNGFYIDRLAPGREMVLRASAPGYVSAEVKVTPTTGPQTGVVIELKKMP